MIFSSRVFPGLLAPARATARELAKSDLPFREVEGKSGLFICREGNVVDGDIVCDFVEEGQKFGLRLVRLEDRRVSVAVR